MLPPSPAFVNAPPCSTSWDEKIATGDKTPDGQTIPPAYGQDNIPYVTCGYTPNQLQGAYGTKSAIAGGLDGHGQTVAIVDAFASPTIEQDANQYASLHGQPPVPFSQIKPEDRSNDPIGGPDECDAQGWYGEETLDVEAVHAMAPGAHELFVGGAYCLDESLIDAVNKMVDGNPDDLELLRQPRGDRRGRRPAPGVERHLPPGRPRGHRDVLLLRRQR